MHDLIEDNEAAMIPCQQCKGVLSLREIAQFNLQAKSLSAMVSLIIAKDDHASMYLGCLIFKRDRPVQLANENYQQ